MAITLSIVLIELKYDVVEESFTFVPLHEILLVRQWRKASGIMHLFKNAWILNYIWLKNYPLSLIFNFLKDHICSLCLNLTKLSLGAGKTWVQFCVLFKLKYFSIFAQNLQLCDCDEKAVLLIRRSVLLFNNGIVLPHDKV